jgi:tetratricopeptide (TPR) repeat protein
MAASFYRKLRAGNCVRAAERAAASGRPDKAVALYVRGVALAQGDTPLQLAARRGAADLLIRIDRQAEAVEHLSEVVRLEPPDADAWRQLAKALKAGGRSQEAADAWAELLKRRHDDVAAHRELGNWLYEAGRPAEAAPHLEIVARHAPSDVKVWRRTGVAAQAAGDLATAAAAWRRVLDLSPDDRQAHETCLKLLERTGPKADTVRHLRWLAAARPEEAACWSRLASRLEELGDLAGAAEALGELLQRQPQDDAARERIIDLLERDGRPADALAHLRALAEARPGDPAAWSRLASRLEELGDLAGATAALGRLLDESPRSGPARERIVDLLDRLGRPAEAVLHVRWLAEAAPAGKVKPWRRLAERQEQIGDLAGAAEAWDRVVAINPSDGPSRERLIEVLERQGRLAETVGQLAWFAQAAPDKPKPAHRYAKRLDDLGDPGAVDAWARVVALAPDDAAVRERLVILLEAHGRLPDTLDHLRRLVEAAPDKVKLVRRYAQRLEDLGLDGAADAWARVAALVPDDVPVRERLVELLERQGRLAETVEHLRWLAEIAPGKVKPARRHALRLEEVGDDVGAASAWTRILAQVPDDADARERLVEALERLGRLQDTVEHLRWLAKAGPEPAEAARRLAHRLKALGQDREGQLEAWLRVLQAAPADREALEAAAQLLQALGRPAEAVAHLRTMVKLAPGRIKELRRLAHGLRAAGEAAEELQAWRRVLELDGAHVEAHSRIADLQVRADNLAAAFPHFEAIAWAQPGEAKAWKRLAQTAEELGRPKAAMAAWRRLLKAAPGDAGAHARLAELLAGEGRPDRAVTHLRALAKAAPDGPKNWKALALALEREGDASGAATAWRRALKLSPDDVQAHDRLARLLQEQGRKNDALVHLRRLTFLEPDSAARWIGLARQEMELENNETSVAAWRRALELQPTDEVHGSLGLLLYRLDRLKEALPHLEAYVAARPEDVKSWRRLARCLRDLGDPEAAARAWREVLAIAGEDEEARHELVVGGRSGEADTFVQAQQASALALLGFWGRARAQDSEGAPDIARSVLGDVLAALEALVEDVKLNNPDGIAARRRAIVSVCADPRFADLADRFPPMVAAFFERLGEAKIDRGVLLEDVAAALAERPAHAATLPAVLRAQLGPEEALAGAELLLQDAGFRSPVLICGFHHSGTRLLARMLEAVGVFQQVNMPTHEWTYVQWLNTLMLPGWADPEACRAFDGTAGAGVIRPENLALRLAAAGYGGGAWGQKDPRNCVTADAWLRAFPRARIINVVRSPVDTLGTLPERYARHTPGGGRPQQALEFWIGLWEAYLDRTRRAMARADHAIEVDFGRLCTDPEGVMRAVVAALKLEGEAGPGAFDGLGIDAGKIGDHRRWVERGDLTDAQAERLAAVAAAAGVG